MTATYEEALVTFRDLLDDGVDHGGYSEYVRGGVNLIADLFPVVGQPVDERMKDVLEDLRKIPQFAVPRTLAEHGVKPYEHDPEHVLEIVR